MHLRASRGWPQAGPSLRQIRRLIAHSGDACTVCRRPFEHNAITTTGYVGAVLHRAGDCCADRMEVVVGFGTFLSNPSVRAADVARRGGVRQSGRGLLLHLGDDAWSKDDARWFAARPDRAHRLRAPLPGEIDGPPAARFPTIPRPPRIISTPCRSPTSSIAASTCSSLQTAAYGPDYRLLEILAGSDVSP